MDRQSEAGCLWTMLLAMLGKSMNCNLVKGHTDLTLLWCCVLVSKLLIIVLGADIGPRGRNLLPWR